MTLSRRERLDLVAQRTRLMKEMNALLRKCRKRWYRRSEVYTDADVAEYHRLRRALLVIDGELAESLEAGEVLRRGWR